MRTTLLKYQAGILYINAFFKSDHIPLGILSCSSLNTSQRIHLITELTLHAAPIGVFFFSFLCFRVDFHVLWCIIRHTMYSFDAFHPRRNCFYVNRCVSCDSMAIEKQKQKRSQAIDRKVITFTCNQYQCETILLYLTIYSQIYKVQRDRSKEGKTTRRRRRSTRTGTRM